MRKIIITADSTADVTPELKKEFGLEIMRFSLNTGNACFPDRVEEPDKMLSLLDMTENTLQILIPPQRTDYEDFFDDLAEKNYDIIHVSQGQAWSAAYKNAMAAAKNTMVKFRNRLVFVTDSRGTAAGQALILDSALAAKAKGESPEEIFSLADELSLRTERYFILPDASRFNSLYPTPSGSLAESAQTVAVVSADGDGNILSVKRFRSFFAACKHIAEAYLAADNKLPCYIYGSADVDPLLKAVSFLRKRGISDIRMSSMGAANCCIFGKGAVSVAFIGKPLKAASKRKLSPGKPTDIFEPEE